MKLLSAIFFSLISSTLADFDRNWWKHSTIYDIVVWSFKDSDGDGYGDLPGVTSKLNYLSNLGVNVIKLSPIYSSPESIGDSYGVDNFTDIHSTLGTLDDFDDLMNEAKKKGIKVILDINFNHCHITHQWFQRSLDGIEPYKHYFVWKNSANGDLSLRELPNYWRVYGDYIPAWKWEDKRQQFYYAVYGYSKPDFDLRNNKIIDELKKIIGFWFNKGVSGFNIVGKEFYLEDENVYEDERYYYHEDTYEFIRNIRDFVDIYNNEYNGHERILATDSGYSTSDILKSIGNKDFPLVHFVSNNIVGYWFFVHYPSLLIYYIKDYAELMNDEIIFEWQFYQTRPNKDDTYTKTIFTITAILPGIWHIPYGAELGMKAHDKLEKYNMNKKFVFRNSNFLPMQWDDSKNGGFSDSDDPIQAPNPDYLTINAEKQINEEISFYHLTQDLLEVRKKETIRHGNFNIYAISERILAVVRAYKGHETIITLASLENLAQTIDLTKSLKTHRKLPPRLKVLAASTNFFYQKGNQLSSSHFTMRPYSCVVLTTEH